MTLLSNDVSLLKVMNMHSSVRRKTRKMRKKNKKELENIQMPYQLSGFCRKSIILDIFFFFSFLEIISVEFPLDTKKCRSLPSFLIFFSNKLLNFCKYMSQVGHLDKTFPDDKNYDYYLSTKDFLSSMKVFLRNTIYFY